MLKFNDPELQDRYLHDPLFRENTKRTQDEYQRLLKRAEGRSLCVPDEIMERFKKEGDQAIYFFYGYLQPHPGTATSDLSFSFLRNFRPEPREQFVFVYFNNETPSSDYYFEFKKVLALLPLTVLENLKQFILVKPYFYIKAFDYIGLGSLNRLLKCRYVTVDSCPQLVEKLGIAVKDFVTFVPQEISAEFPKTFKKRPSLVSYRINLEGQNMSEEQRKEKTQFEATINALITKEVYKLQNYEVGDIGIPIILQLLVHYFRTKPEGLDEEGIFRKSVSIDQENQTLNQLSRRNFQYLQQIKNPFLIASLIKRFFSNLKEPIILFKTYEQLLHDQGVKDKRQHVKRLMKELPNLNFMTLAFVIQFLKKDVLPHQSKSKMSANNLAICFSPSLMRSEKPSMADIANASKAVAITNILISDFQLIFGTQEHISKMYKSNLRRANQDFTSIIQKELQLEEQLSRQSAAITAITEPKPMVKKSEQPSIILDTAPIQPQPAPSIQIQSTESEVEPIGPEPPLQNTPMLSGDKKSDIQKQAQLSSNSSHSFEVLGKEEAKKEQQLKRSSHSRSSKNLLEVQVKRSGPRSEGEPQLEGQIVGEGKSSNIISPVMNSKIRFSYSSKKDNKDSA